MSSDRYVVEQLQCLGILQTCEVLKVGMPTRVTYTELKEVRIYMQSYGPRKSILGTIFPSINCLA